LLVGLREGELSSLSRRYYEVYLRDEGNMGRIGVGGMGKWEKRGKKWEFDENCGF